MDAHAREKKLARHRDTENTEKKNKFEDESIDPTQKRTPAKTLRKKDSSKSRGSQRQREIEGAALAWRALYSYLAAEFADDTLHDGESQAVPLNSQLI